MLVVVLVERIWDRLLLVSAERRALLYTPAERARVRAKDASACSRVAVTRELTAPRDGPVVASLLYDAVELRLEAAGVRRDVAAADDLRREALRDLPSRDALDRVDPAALDELIETLRRTEQRLRGESEPRSPLNIRATRYGRVAALMVAVAYVLATALAQATAPPNVAFHRKVTLSGIVHGNASELVDGVRETMKPVLVVGAPPTIEIDLGGVYAIDSVRITNREDAHLDSAIPTTVYAAAERPDAWEEVEASHLIHYRTLTVPCRGLRARWIRVTAGQREAGLNEIEVFGRYAPR